MAALARELRELEAERAQWAARREASAARLIELSALLGPAATASEQRSAPADAVSTQTKQQLLVELKARTKSIAQRQKQVAETLAQQLRRLRLKRRATAAVSPAKKPKHAPTTTRPGNKQLVLPRSELDVQYPILSLEAGGELELGDASSSLAPAILRVATRHLLRTGSLPSADDVEAEFQQYTGQSLPGRVADLVASLAPSAARVVSRFMAVKPDARSESSALQRWRPAGPWPRSLGDPLTPRHEVSGGQEERIAAWLHTEHRTLQDALSALQRLEAKAPKAELVRRTVDVTCFLDALAGGACAEWTLESLVFALTAAPSAASFRVEYAAIPSLSALLEACERRLETRSAGSESRSRSSAAHAMTPLTAERRPAALRPFDLSSDSVLRQLRPQESEPPKTRVDPMKTWCMFELSGVCNDESCPFQHQRDLTEAAATATPSALMPTQVADLLEPSARSTLAQLTQLCEDLRSRWPTLDELLAMPEAFLSLESPDSSPEDLDNADDVRYYGRHSVASSANATELPVVATLSLSELEQRVEHNASDVDAWLMLALRHLRVSESVDEPSAFVDHLLSLSNLLDGVDGCVAKAQIEQSLHTLARALEVESNAYCDVIWWLHLRLAALLRRATGASSEPQGDEHDTKTLETEQVEQALEFVPTSVALWRHYLSLLDVGSSSLEDATGSMMRLLQHLTTLVGQLGDATTQRAMRELLCDMVLRVCTLYCSAGAELKAENLLAQLVAAETDAAWHVDVINCLSARERVVLVLAFVHVSLTGRLPAVLSSRGLLMHDAVELQELEGLCTHSIQHAAPLSRLERVLDLCESAMEMLDSSEESGVQLKETLGVVSVALARRIKWLDNGSERLTKLLEREMTRSQPLARVLAALASETDSVWRVAMRSQGPSLARTVHLFLLQHSDRFSPPRAQDNAREEDLPCFSELLGALARCLEVDLDELAQFSSPIDALSLLVTRAAARVLASQSPDATYALVSALQLVNHVTEAYDRSLRALDELLPKTRSLPSPCRELLHSLRVVWQLEALSSSSSAETDVMAAVLSTIRKSLIAFDPTAQHRERLATAFRQARDSEKDEQEDASPPSLSDMLMLVLPPRSVPQQRVPRFLVELVQLALHAFPSHERERFLATLLQQGPAASPSAWPVDMALLQMATAPESLNSFGRRHALQALRQHAMHSSRLVDHRVLRWLVASDLLQRNFTSLALLLSRRLQANALDAELWRLLALLETLRSPVNQPSNAGEDENCGKTQMLSWATAQTRVATGVELSVWSCADAVSPPLSSLTALSTWRGLGLHRLPLSLNFHWKALRTLDLSANLLVTIPNGVFNGLTALEELDLSQNALLSLPSTLATLPALRVLRLAHNHLSVLPEHCLDGWAPSLETLDVRHNALASVSPRVLRLTRLRELRLEGNTVTWSAFEPIALKLSACTVDLARPTQPPATKSATTTAKPPELHSGRLDEEMVVAADNCSSPQDLSAATREQDVASDDDDDDDDVEFVGSSQSAVETTPEEIQNERDAPAPPAPTMTRTTPPSQSDAQRLDVLKAHLPRLRGLGSCVCCGAANERDLNQRLNTMVLCPRCLLAAVRVLESRSSEDEETKGADA
ncbi:hypothetical protein ATCC90586_001602 [Pythium insidiosum]|nr:hypothetical protein ATCC90586_001602 [Pythium insidiosum]